MTFKDKTGHEWSLELTLGTVTRCRKVAKADLGRGMTKLSELAELIDDPDRFIACLLVITQEQRDKAGLASQEEFEDRFDGPALQAARAALMEAVTNFYHPPKSAAEMTATLRKTWTAGDELIAAKIRTASETVSTSNDSVTNSAGPAA